MEFKSFVKFSLLIFKAIGFDLMEELSVSESIGKKLISVLKKLFYWFLLISLVLFAFFSGIFGYLNFKDLDLSAGSTANCLLLTIYTAKGIVIWTKRSAIVLIMKDLKIELDKLLQRDEARKLIEKTYKNFDKYQKIYAALVVTSGFTFGITPIIQLISSGVWDLKLPHPMWLPFEITNIFTYLVTYIFLEFLSLAAKGFFISIDLIFNALIVVLSLEFEILALDLEDFDINSGYEEIIKLVSRHCKLIQISEKLEQTFAVMNFIAFIGSSLILTFPAFQIVSSDESFTILKFSFFFGAALLQTLRLCYY